MAESHNSAVRKMQARAHILSFTMNILRSKKKAAPEPLKPTNDTSFGFGPTSPLAAQPDVKKSSSSRWKKKKQAEPEPDVDFELSLPSNDDFRTSLLMPNLSARFSMLREQDDPMSLIGKASDDSVLAPRRRSRLGDFGFSAGGLHDIAEVRSINSSIRPPFLSQDRQSSYGSEDGYGSENDSTINGSMRSRARPGKGNNLFGGRQKIYRIPTSGVNSTRSAGKAVYEDDLGQSAFQRYRQREREEVHDRPSEDSSGFDFGLDHSDVFSRDDRSAQNPNDSAKDLLNSPSLSAYDKKRSTTSSVTRSEARSSTAATSVASQTLNSSSPLVTPQIAPAASLPSVKNRRLYEQGLDQHIQDQQSSAITRLNSIQRQRNFAVGGIQSSNTLTSPPKTTREYGDRGMSINNGPQSPTATTFGAVRKPSLRTANSSGYANQPASPTALEYDENFVLNNALEPGDRGKATALGAFNKPKNQFDEHQYLERQHQMMRSQSRAGSGKDSAEVSPVEPRFARFDQPNRLRSNSEASTHSRSGSHTRKFEPSKGYNVFQNAANSGSGPAVSAAQRDLSFDQNRNSNGDGSNDDHQSQSNGFGGAGNRGWQPNALPPVSEHPALRAQRSMTTLNRDNQDSLPSYLRSPLTGNSMPLRTDLHKFKQVEKAVDSPTLGATPSTAASTTAPAAGPLNGMMQHLRSGSNVSSVYPNDEESQFEDDAPTSHRGPWTAKDMDMHHMPIRDTLDLDPLIQATYASSNPWATNETDQIYSSANKSHHFISPMEERHLDSSRTPLTNGSTFDHHDVSPQVEPTALPWEDGSRREHTRDTSIATQQERDAFADELAARRNAIKENMKTLVERESNSRGVSPSRSASSTFKTFGISRSKNSRESLISKKDVTHDPMPLLRPKVFGGLASAHSSNADLHHDQHRPNMNPRSRDNSATRVDRPRNNSGARPPVPHVQTRTLQSSEREQSRARGYSEASLSEHRQLASERRSPATSQGPRSRSNSSRNGNARSRSRTRPYRDDLQRAMVEGMGNSAAGHPDISPMITRETTPRMSSDRSWTERGSLEQVNSTGMSSYFEPKAAWQQHSQESRGPMAGPVQTTLANAVGSPVSSSPSRSTPATSPFSPNMVSAPSTSTTAPYSSQPIQPQMQKGTLRKKTISKSEISEPTLISSTSNVDTVDLPPGASLKNGIDEVAPLTDNKRRGKGKLFGRNRSGSSVENGHYAARTKSPDANYVPAMPMPSGPRSARSNSNLNDNTPRYDMATTLNNESYHGNVAMHDHNYGSNMSSPERTGRCQIEADSRPNDGGMF
ncbi:Hypothetical protein R9X50_00573600 [Acrodontium crateriforme]|uniref:Uncharacterized protein n=1 Tax=Acrodontium crateriforme TaxID=150365 RepID=A0AAQ3M8I3_9PEZI|nr:Hypothetical protein R9X50_00573600 [Acrodontium crateriforme]